MIMERRSAPIKTLSLACSKSSIRTDFWLRRGGSRAASLGRLCTAGPRKRPVHRKYVYAPLDPRPRHDRAAVEASRAQERRVEHVRAVGGGDEDDAFVGVEPVHLHQHGVQRLLALVVAAAQAGPAG